MIKRLKSICVISLFIILQISSGPQTCLATFPKLSYSYQNDAWLIEYTFSEFRGEPNEKIQFNIKISSRKNIYDFRVWVESPHLDISSKNKKSNLHYDLLREGDIIEDDLEISIPETAQYGESYSLAIKIQSHTNRDVGGVRILDDPENIFNNQDMPDYTFQIRVQQYPQLKIVDKISLLQKGQINEFKIKIRNSGNADAEKIYYTMIFPSSFEIIGEVNGYIDTIPSDSYKDIIVQIKPLESGSYESSIYLEASNHQNINSIITFEVQDFNIYLYGFIIIIVILIIVFKIITS